MKRFAPFFLFALLCMALVFGLAGGRQDVQPQALVGRPFPVFILQNQNVDALLAGKVTVVNIFASWCTPCALEQPTLMELQKKNIVPIIGIAWKNKSNDLDRWIARLGNPYTHLLLDERGVSTIPLALTGVPETFVVDKNGIIAYQTDSPITQQLLDEEIIPLVERLQK